MFGNAELTRCLERKTALLGQSAAFRMAVAKEARTLREVAAWVDCGIDVARGARVGWNGLTLLLAFWNVRKQTKSSLARKLDGALSVIRLVTGLWNIWR